MGRKNQFYFKNLFFYFFVFCISGNILFSATQAAFLKISPGAKQSSMGDASTAISGDAYSIYYNPAGLSDVLKKETAFSYNQWVMDTTAGYASFVLPVSGAAFGLGIQYFSSGEITKTGIDVNGGIVNNLGTFNSSEYALSLGYGKKMKALRLGLNLNYVHSGVDDLYNEIISFDLGGKYVFSNDLRTSIVLKNIGDSRLPSIVIVGMAKKILSDKLTFETDVNQYISGKAHIALGMIYDIPVKDFMNSTFSFRMGYKTGYIETGDTSGISAGFGYSLDITNIKFILDYCFSFYGFLGNSNKLSLSIRF